MRINLLKFLHRTVMVVFLVGLVASAHAQQPTSPQTVPTIDPTTVTPEQIKEFQEYQEKQKDQSNDKDQSADKKDEEAKEEGDDNQTEVEKRKKANERVKEEAGLPIFGNEIFNGSGPNTIASTNRPTPENYVLGPGDKLTIDVTGNSVVSWSLTVNPDGSILIPGIGKLYVAGKTIENATESIKDKLRANRYAVGQGTDVSVTLANIRSIRITVMGEVQVPGDKVVSSLTTVFNALYESGGITRNGTYRGIKVIRNNEQIAQIDMYDYLLRGDMSSNIALKDGDIIQVPPYRVRVSIEGEVKKPAYYEVLPGEALKDVIVFAGGFTDYAYKFNIKAVQLTDRQQKIKDINQSDFESYVPLKGDQYVVSRILNKYENRVSIVGSVYRPGDFELTDGLTLKELILKADGLKEDAYQERGYITRLKDDNSSEKISFYVKAIMDGTQEDILLMREDVVQISSIFDYTDAYTVTVNGKVRAGGTFAYFNGMTVQDLILKGGGFADGANMAEVEIARRVKDSDKKAKDAKLANIIKVVIDKDLKVADSKFKLQPFDVVSVFALPGYVKPQMVTIEGEVMMPGTYAMISKNDRISDLVARANGFTAYAYLNGASLKRGDYAETSSEAEKQALKLNQFAEKQAEASEGKSLVDLANPTKRNNFVDIELAHIIKNPKSRKDLILLDGDVLSVPRELQTVKISGEVYSPTTTVFSPGQSLSEYVLRSGGFTEGALKRGAYVVYANGANKGTRHFLFFKNYPNVEPGAEIFIPKRKPRKERDGTNVAQTWVGLSASVASIAAVVFAIISANK